MHTAYLEAGADIITTASYQGSVAGFVSAGFSENKAIELLQSSVSLAKEARDSFWSKQTDKNNGGNETSLSNCSNGVHSHQGVKNRPLVAASLGSYGAILCNGAEYTGDFGPDVTVEVLVRFHRERLAILAVMEPDLVIFETIPSPEETSAVSQVLQHFQIPAIISFSCKDGVSVCHGEPFASCVEALIGADNVLAVGVNCTAPQHVEALLRSARKAIDEKGAKMGLVCYPNSGEDWSRTERRYIDDESHLADFPQLARRLADAGLINIIGGCCRTTPELICAVAKEIHGRK